MFTKHKTYQPGDHIFGPDGTHADWYLEKLASENNYDGRVAQRELERRAKERSEK